MYFILIVAFLILSIWLVIFILRPSTKGVKLIYFLLGTSVLSVSILIAISHYYKRLNPLALILALIVTTALILLYAVRRLR